MKKDFHEIGTKEKRKVKAGESMDVLFPVSRLHVYSLLLICIFLLRMLLIFLQKEEFESYRNGDLSIVSSKSDPVSFLCYFRLIFVFYLNFSISSVYVLPIHSKYNAC
jgi:hypothetical protein